jgi:hypothetical protein
VLAVGFVVFAFVAFAAVPFARVLIVFAMASPVESVVVKQWL